MNDEIKGYRFLVFLCLCLLTILLALMANKLFSELQDLSVSDGASFKVWHSYQTKSQLADLDSNLTEEIANENLLTSRLQESLDIALSKVFVLKNDESRAYLWDGEVRQDLLNSLLHFETFALAISEKPAQITVYDLKELKGLLQKARLAVDQIARLDEELTSNRSLVLRMKFSRQLTWTGGFAISFLVMLTGLLITMDRMLLSAMKRTDALTVSSRQLEATVAGSMDAIVIADGFSKIIEYNSSAEGVFGWTREEIIGKTMEEIFFLEGLGSTYKNAMNQTLERESSGVFHPTRVELSGKRKNGEEFPVELNMTFVEHKNDAIFMAYIRDISERKIAEQELIAARDRAESAGKAKSRFLAVMSHEMRTPLAGIVGVMDLLSTTKLTKKQIHYLQMATSSSKVLLEHINEALDITRIDAGELEASFQEFDMADMVKNLVGVLKLLANEKNIEFRLQLEKNTKLFFLGDGPKIRQILTNLIGNSIKFTDQGNISLSITGIDDTETSIVNFIITDTGLGIATENQEKIFDDFIAIARSDPNQIRSDGMGLPISRKIARLMGGDIKVKSEIGKGAEFTLSLPLQRVRKNKIKVSKLSELSKVKHQNINALVVEDNNINGEVLTDMLEGMGHSVSRANNGLEALDQANIQLFDIIFMDINMPFMGGIKTTYEIRANSRLNSKTRIIGLTAHSSEDFDEKAKQAGMDYFFTKPIRLEILTKIIDETVPINQTEVIAELSPVLTNLFETLGREKVLRIGEKFFEELDVFIQQSIDGFFTEDHVALVEATHKMKGAAMLLGQNLLKTPLDKLECHTLEGDTTDLQITIQSLRNVAQQSKAAFFNFTS
jgi:PAS domain S-box-containing protein